MYFAALDDAIEHEPPPFDTSGYADLYTEASADWRWLAISLMTNAEREGDGAKRLWSLAACSDDTNVQQQLKHHAVDESRHALLYLALLDLTFPDSVEPGFREELNTLSPRYSLHQPLRAVAGSPYAKKPTVDDFIQMNVAEIRTTIHHIMQRPAVANHCATDKHRKVLSIQESLLRDELKHVSYTAVLIEAVAQRLTRAQLTALFRRRFRDFNQITRNELGVGVFDCSVACCAKHTSCRPTATSPGVEPPPITLRVQ